MTGVCQSESCESGLDVVGRIKSGRTAAREIFGIWRDLKTITLSVRGRHGDGGGGAEMYGHGEKRGGKVRRKNLPQVCDE